MLQSAVTSAARGGNDGDHIHISTGDSSVLDSQSSIQDKKLQLQNQSKSQLLAENPSLDVRQRLKIQPKLREITQRRPEVSRLS